MDSQAHFSRKTAVTSRPAELHIGSTLSSNSPSLINAAPMYLTAPPYYMGVDTQDEMVSSMRYAEPLVQHPEYTPPDQRPLPPVSRQGFAYQPPNKNPQTGQPKAPHMVETQVPKRRRQYKTGNFPDPASRQCRYDQAKVSMKRQWVILL
jgi:hypothetical protein